MSEGIYVIDPRTKEEVLLPYEEIDPAVYDKALVPVGGFCYRASDFLHLPLAKVPFFIESWLPKQGKCLIYGRAKAGKSFLALQIADCIGQGRPFVGVPTRQGRVLYMQFELGQEALQGRMQATGHSYHNVYVGTTFAMKLDKSQGQTRLEVAINDIRPDVVILDPMYKVLSGDENISHDVALVFDFLDTLSQSYKTSFVIMHHAGRDLSRGARGSTTFTDWVDTELELKKVSNNGQPLRVELTPKYQRHAEIPPDPLILEMQGFEFKPIALEDNRVTIKAQILEHIRVNDKDHKAEDLISLFGSRKSVYDALNELVDEDKIYRVKRGYYRYGPDPLLEGATL